MAALLDQQGTTTSALVEAAGATTTQLVQTTRRSLDALPSVTGSSVASPTPSRSTLAVLENARAAMAAMSDTCPLYTARCV